MSDNSDIDDEETIHTVSDVSEELEEPNTSDDEFIDNDEYEEIEQDNLYIIMKQIYDILLKHFKP